jgi:hypothetical protein
MRESGGEDEKGSGKGGRSRFHIHAAHFGQISLGTTTVAFDEETLTIVASAADERSARVRLSNIDAVHVAENVLTIELQDGTHLRLHGDRLTELRTAVLDGCRMVPEVTRALRAFGSRRGQRGARATGADEQHRFFTPLLVARRAASAAITPAEVIAAFDAEALARAFNAALVRFAEERYRESPPARRALTAELTDLAEPLQATLDSLRDAERSAAADLEDLRSWREWAAAVRATFEIADRVWLTLDDALDAAQRRLPSVSDAQRGGAKTPSSSMRRHDLRRRSE